MRLDKIINVPSNNETKNVKLLNTDQQENFLLTQISKNKKVRAKKLICFATMFFVSCLTVSICFALLVKSKSATLTTTAVTCSSTHCALGEPTDITCHFHRNINSTRPGVNVIRYSYESGGKDNGKTVLQCIWSRIADAPECYVEDGYIFNKRIDDHLTLEIPVATEEVAGLYICHVVPPDGTSPNMCDLFITDSGKTKRPTVSTPAEGPSKRTTHTPKDEDSSTEKSPVKDELSKEAKIIIVIGVGVVLLIIALIAVLCYLILRRERMRGSERRRDDQEPDCPRRNPNLSQTRNERSSMNQGLVQNPREDGEDSYVDMPTGDNESSQTDASYMPDINKDYGHEQSDWKNSYQGASARKRTPHYPQCGTPTLKGKLS